MNDSYLQKDLNEKNIINETDEKLSKKDEIYNSIYYEKNKSDNDEFKYIRKDKIKRKKKDNINKFSEGNYKEQSDQDTEENELEKVEESNNNIGNIIQ